MRAAFFGPAVVILVVLSSACGGGGDASETSPGGPAPSLPACAKAPPAAPSDRRLPIDFPLPPGTVVTSADSPRSGQLVVVGLVPADLQEATAFFGESLPERGFRVGVGDAEGSESEAPFTGNGYRGKWRVNEISGCPALKLTLVLIEQS